MTSKRHTTKYLNILEWSDGSIHIEVIGMTREIMLIRQEREELEQYFQQKAME